MTEPWNWNGVGEKLLVLAVLSLFGLWKIGEILWWAISHIQIEWV